MGRPRCPEPSGFDSDGRSQTKVQQAPFSALVHGLLGFALPRNSKTWVGDHIGPAGTPFDVGQARKGNRDTALRVSELKAGLVTSFGHYHRMMLHASVAQSS